MEYTTLVECADKCEIALSGDKAITHFLLVNGIITDEIFDSVNDPKSMLTSRDKSRILVNDIKKMVCLNPQNYHKLIRYFRENKLQYVDILAIFDEKFTSMRERHRQ